MYDAARVGLRDRDARLEDEIDRLLGREPSALLEEAIEIDPLEELHDHVRRAVGQGSEVDDARHLLARELGRDLRLAREPIRRGVVLPIGREQLDGDALAERYVRREEHEPHAALPELRLDAVFARDDVAR